MLAAPAPEGFEPIVCPQCGEPLVIRWGRNSGKAMVYHSLTQLWCPDSGAAWYGSTRAEAIANFRGSTESRRAVVRGASDCGGEEHESRTIIGARLPISGSSAPPPENSLSGKRVGYSECHDAATPPAQNFRKEGDEPCITGNLPITSNAAPKVQPSGAATIAGWEVSGLDEEEINKLLSEK